ncbi:hypothetical protein [Amycolatopsis samaneae]|uniref:Extracellular repeat, HAF family n=1 Tax=Amycolatopsis samaneae TaxID=664691 RepID=A0ABW5GKB2_9PSEU
MKRTFRLLFGAAIATAVVAGPGTMSAAAAGCSWKPSALPLPSGGLSGVASATDHAGGVAGVVKFSDKTTRIVYWKNGKTTEYGSYLSGLASVQVKDQNRSGTIVGSVTVGRPSIPPRISAFRITANGLENLASPDGATMTFPSGGINDKGDIVGGYRTSRSSPIAGIRWPAGSGKVEKLDGLADVGYIGGLDEDGTVLYSAAETSIYQQRPFLWKNGKSTALAKPAQVGDLQGEAISAGRVVGKLYYQNSSGKYVDEAIFWDTDGVPHKLPSGQSAEDINRNGVSVGASTDDQAAVWRLGALDAKLGKGTVAHAIGDDGVIAGSRTVNNVEQPTVWRCG